MKAFGMRPNSDETMFTFENGIRVDGKEEKARVEFCQ
jgi:hypothetical protein